MVDEERKRREAEKDAADRTNSSMGMGGEVVDDEKKMESSGAEEWLKRGIEKMARGEEFDEAPPVGDFEVVDKLIKRICDGEVMEPMAGKKKEGEDGMGDGIAQLLGIGMEDTTVGGIMKLCLMESKENRVYLRTSGGLEKLCEQAKGEGEGFKERRGVIFKVLAEAVRGVKKNKVRGGEEGGGGEGGGR